MSITPRLHEAVLTVPAASTAPSPNHHDDSAPSSGRTAG